MSSWNRASALVVLAASLFLAGSAPAADWYVRTDGGTDAQCTGLVDAAYTGSGTAQACAFAHPFWALTASGAWKIAGGDTLAIAPGSYRIGYGAPNTGWCDTSATWDCTFPALPPGTVSVPTRLVGSGWNAGCPAKPEFFGVERASQVLSLDGTSHALVACLEITDHSSCVESHSTPSVACERDTYPHGDWAPNGVYAADSGDVTLQDLNVHGLAGQGILSGRLSNWTVTRVRLAGNGWAGWNGDLGVPSSNSGAMTFRSFTVEWNGCSETYPGLAYDHCWAQQAGGYGDGFGTASTGGSWLFEDSLFRYNTSDGLDLLYAGVSGETSSIVVRRTVSVGNAGNQLKLAGPADVVNTLVVGNCGFFYGKPFALEMQEGDQCRAMGNALALSPHTGSRVRVYNTTIVSQGDCILDLVCDTGNCNGIEDVQFRNNVVRGYVDWRQPWEQSCYMWDPGALLSGTRNDSNVVFDVKENGECSWGPANVCGSDPLFVNGDISNFDGHLQAGSPARDSGLSVGSFGIVPSEDLERRPRPIGSGVDRGAYEYDPDGTAGGTRFYTLTPCRVFDTRLAAGPLGGPVLAAGQTRSFTLTGACDIPATAKTLSGNLTVVAPAAAGWLRAYAGDAAPPSTSNINFRTGQIRANNGLFPLAANGSGTLNLENGSSASAHAVFDVNGYFE